MLSRLFIAALWSPARKGLTSWLLCVMFYCVFVTFLCGILGKMWYLIVSIPDICYLSYFPNLQSNSTVNIQTGKCIRRFSGIYAYYRYFIDRKW